MKSRKQKSAKAGICKKKVPSDVSPSTSLPPLVEGQLRCFLQVTVSRVLWTVHKPPPATFVRLRWWGESSNGTYFFPRDGSQLSQKTIKTTARFPICCGPKQFTSYLADMGSLVLEALTKSDHLPIARAQVSSISRLTLTHPISGFYTLLSPKSEKVGELQVSLNLEPLVEAYDSSSGPNADVTSGEPTVTTLMVPPKSPEVGSGKKSAGRTDGNTPRGKDHLYFRTAQKDKGKDESLENQIPATNRSQNRQTEGNPSIQESRGQLINDILPVILERGNKLRNAMVVSALKCDLDSVQTLKDIPLPLQKDNARPISKLPPPPSGMFLQNILEADSTVKHSGDVPECRRDCPADMDHRVLELLLGRLNTSPPPLWDGETSLPESLSSHSSVGVDSELNDPQYDKSLLENLFYKTAISDTIPDDTEVDVQKREKPQTHAQKKSSDNPGPEPHPGGGIPLSEEQLTLLSLIRVAKVTIDSLTVPPGSTTSTPRTTARKGKPPPPPLTNKKCCTFFVEYVFPMASAASRPARSAASDVEVTRAVSNKGTGGVVKFHQHSVFPVHLSKSRVEQWWGTDLIFKIHSRKHDQKKPVLIGKAVHPLRCLLQSKQLSQCVALPVHSVEGNKDRQEIGPLKVSLELAADNKDPYPKKSKSKVAWRDVSFSHTLPSPDREPSSICHQVDTGREETPYHSLEDTRLNSSSPQKSLKVSSPPHPSLHTIHHKSQHQVEEDPEILLHMLLMVPDGKNFTYGPMQAPNIYLNCKLFWCDDMARSVVSWGQANPSFNFVQVTPVALTRKLLERMKNNMMVIEVWQKMGSSGQDRLVGLVKLPLHQFYMSFRDSKIAHLLLQAQFPVLGVDCYMPVVDVFSGSCKGNLRVVLAMGRPEQILALQRTRDEEADSWCHPVRPVHLLDHQPHTQTKGSAAQEQSFREHLFMIRVEKISGLTPLQSTVWGEADCYVQYSFPCQEGDSAAELDATLYESSMNLKPFRTTTTLCVPDPLFGHTETHVLLAPEGVPVQQLLLSSFSSQGPSSRGGVTFEVWCRYYYPNVRDQLVAKGLLPLSKLCAMVTMQKQHPDEAQMFSLSLVPRTDSPSGHQPQPSGLLDVCIRYKHRPVRPEGQTGRGAASRIVTLVAQVHRACGLQAAARSLSEQDERFSYFAEVGVNTYITVQFSFLPENEKRCTRVVARTFCPEFDHHMEVPCDMLVQRSSGESCSLAEQLEEASVVFTVWNRDNRKASASKPKDVILGTVKIRLADLTRKRTGIYGWFGIRASQDQLILVGGLEISVSFTHPSDRERVIKAAQGLGWEMPYVDCERLNYEEEDVWKMLLTLSMPRAWMPVHCLLLPGHTELQRSTYCYLRYKFYDQDAFCSQLKHPSVIESGEESQAVVSFEGSRTVELMSTQPLMWYLLEERLEVQVWVAFKKDKTQRPSDTDRLVGSAFIDLSSLAKTEDQKLTLSGVYPLFRHSATNLQGAALRVHITLTSSCVPRNTATVHHNEVDSDSQGEQFLEAIEAADEAPSPTPPAKSLTQSLHQETSPRAPQDTTSSQHTETSADESFPVTITVDRAMHLNLKGCPLAERNDGTPCCCVSYVTADAAEPVSTAIVANANCPVWDHQHECRLSRELLVDPQQSLVFKVWHKGEMERVIGFASVDLSPLLCGFQSVCGWYNITDFSGQCHGQLKVSITPLKWVQDLRGQRKTVSEEAVSNSSTLFQAFPLSYHTTATYSTFPSHISRYPEQKISSPARMNMLFSESESGRHNEHMDKVRHYHQSLQEQTASQSVCSSIADDISPSSSVLFSALRKKLSELDNIQRYFNCKLSAPIFPAMSEQECHNKQEEHQQESETDTCQLFLKSNQLVGEVNNIISGLRGQHLETIPSNSGSSTSPPVGDDKPPTVPGSVSSLHIPSVPYQEDASHPDSPPPQMSEEHTDSEADEEQGSQHDPATGIEDENPEGTDDDEDRQICGSEEETDDDEDYEEVVVKPRALNEVTSLTDKTSPWTSILSDPDLVSLESQEVQEELELDRNQNEENRSPLTLKTKKLHTLDSSVKHECTTREASHQHQTDSFNGSSDDSSDREGDGDGTLRDVNEEHGEEPTNAEPEDTSTSADDTSYSEETQNPKPPLSVPNFFLPSHKLEASLRAIRLAPSFSQLSSDAEQSAPVHSVPGRGPWPRPNMSPSSMKKETERIAKIFAAQFDDDR
ncbi:C2 domain-containing protein 3 [Aulostomus maculatus]